VPTLGETLAAVGAVVGLVSAAAALMVVPEVRAFFGLAVTPQQNNNPSTSSTPLGLPATSLTQPVGRPDNPEHRAPMVNHKTVKASNAVRIGAEMSSPNLQQILEFLGEQHVRATYGAVAEVLKVQPRSIGTLLGPRNREASWVVNAQTGMPTGYSNEDMDPALFEKPEIIRTGQELTQKMAIWKH